jgi:voltage-gated potassium channel
MLTLIQWLRRRRGDFYRDLTRVVALVLAMNVIFAAAFFLAERRASPDLSFLDSLWWAMVTMTTVGYGDYYARTAAGRFLVSYPAMVVGIGLVAYLAGTVADAVLSRLSRRRKGLLPVKLSDHFVVCNCPSVDSVRLLLSELRNAPEHRGRKAVLVTDRFDELPSELLADDVTYVRGRPAREDVLARAAVADSAGVFVLAEDPTDRASDAMTLATSVMARTVAAAAGRTIRIVVELVSKGNARLLDCADVDGLVFGEGVTDCLLAQEYLHPGTHSIVQDLISNNGGSQLYIHPTRLVGRNVRELQIAIIDHPTNMQLIGVVGDGNLELNPARDRVIMSGERLVFLADQPEDIVGLEAALATPGR